MALLARRELVAALRGGGAARAGLWVRTIYGKEMRETLNVPPRGKPFPYLEKKLHVWNTWWSGQTWKKIDDNSKVIVVDGPPAVGKSKLAKELAEDFDMLHLPEVTMDDYYINEYGYDMRQLDPGMPELCKSFDHTNFCRDPRHTNSGAFQMMMLSLRFSQYVDALIHLLNTGQGVVMERSAFSDFVFLEAMFDCGFVSPGVKSVYYEVKKNVIHELLRPHLVVYLDAPVSVVQERIRERALPHEKDSKALTPQFLASVERNYKQNFLKNISTHAELLVYDWTKPGETEIVIEDIERIDFDQYNNYNAKNSKMSDWIFPKEQALNDARMLYTNGKTFLMHYFNVPRFDVPELIRSAEDEIVRNELWYNAPGMKYEYGYNKDMGDGSSTFKTKLPRKHRFA